MLRRLIQLLAILFLGLGLYTLLLALQLGMLNTGSTPAQIAKTAKADFSIEFAVGYIGIGLALLAAARR
jgi:hypothetical protein